MNSVTNEFPKWYAVKHKSKSIVLKSRSGGVFTALSDAVLQNHGIVYGCVMENNYVLHSRADNYLTRDRMCGSKYVQSDIGDTFFKAKQDLEDGKMVLFSGTSCQLAGLKSFLGKEYEKLYCIDIVCHGVPSPFIWHDYIESQEKKYRAKCVNADFRNKNDFSWERHIETLYMKGLIKMRINSRVYTELFYGHNILRPCCYECPYKSIYHPGDITIADYWGIDKVVPQFDDHKGTSLVLVNNDKGMKLFSHIYGDLLLQETSIENSLQEPLVAPFPCPKDRALFWEQYRNQGFEFIRRNYARDSAVRKIGCSSLVYKIRKKLNKNFY